MIIITVLTIHIYQNMSKQFRTVRNNNIHIQDECNFL